MKRSLFILLGSLFVVMTGYGVTLSVLPFHIERMALAEGTGRSQASIHVGLITGIFAFMQFFFAPLWGRLSDRMGRRAVLAIGMLGFALANVLFGLSTNLTMLYTSRFLGGSLSAAVLPVAAAFVIDLTDETQRGRGMAWMGSAAGLGVMIGPALGGWLAETNFAGTVRFGYFVFDAFSLPFFTAGGLALIALIAILVWLPESLGHKSDMSGMTSGPVLSLILKRPSFRILLSLSFLVQFAMSLFEGTFALHAGPVMGFGPSEMALVLMVCGFVMAAAQGGVISWFVDRFPETRLMLVGMVIMGIALILLMAAKDMSSVLTLTAVFGFGTAIMIPILATSVSRHTKANTGIVLGIQNAVNSLGQAMGPLAGGLLITLSLHLPYLLAGMALLGAAVLLGKRTLNASGG